MPVSGTGRVGRTATATVAGALVLGTAAVGLSAPQPPHDPAHGVQCADCHIPYAGPGASDDSGAVTTATATGLADATKSWPAGRWVGGVVTVMSGASLGAFREVAASGSGSLAWTVPLAVPLAPGDAYKVALATQADIETRCKSCHNPSGTASSKADVGLHAIGDGKVVGCGRCHDPHNVEANSGAGQGLVRARIRWPTAKDPTAFPAAGGNRFITGGPGYSGICETCHTATAHHRNGAGGDHAHYATTPCTDCHRHGGGFQGGDCLSCHAVPQDNGDGVPAGGRRVVSGEFPPGDVHAHYGATLDSSRCGVCHDHATHMDGYVDLIDADDPTRTFRFVRATDLTGDPDVSTFCMSCHDADGAARLSAPLDPFGAGGVPADVASRFAGTLRWNEWYGDQCFGNEGTLRGVNAHHDVSDADQAFSGAKIECLDCHGAHAAGASAPLVDPLSPTMRWQGATNAFCLTCHAGGNGPADPAFPPAVRGPSVPLRGLDTCNYRGQPWWVNFRWQHSAHGPGSKRPWPGYSGAPSADLDCLSCHESHGSVTPANPAGNPYMIRDFVEGVDFLDDGTRTAGWFGPPWSTQGVSRDVRVGIAGLNVGWGGDTGLCKACHAAYPDAYEWHDFCSACQVCHGHGQDWGESDMVDWDSHKPCPN